MKIRGKQALARELGVSLATLHRVDRWKELPSERDGDSILSVRTFNLEECKIILKAYQKQARERQGIKD